MPFSLTSVPIVGARSRIIQPRIILTSIPPSGQIKREQDIRAKVEAEKAKKLDHEKAVAELEQMAAKEEQQAKKNNGGAKQRKNKGGKK